MNALNHIVPVRLPRQHTAIKSDPASIATIETNHIKITVFEKCSNSFTLALLKELRQDAH